MRTITVLAVGALVVLGCDDTPSGLSPNPATLPIAINGAPAISNVTATPNRVVAINDTVALQVVAQDDADGGALTYAWTVTGCMGQLSTTTAANPTFTLTALNATTCTFDVTVSDAQGAATKGSIAIAVGRAPTLTTPAGEDAGIPVPPVLDLTVIGDLSPAGGAEDVFRVYAHDPLARGALTFAWAAPAGTLGTQKDAAGSSELTWTAPACPTTTTTITATVRAGDGTAVTKNFTVSTACP